MKVSYVDSSILVSILFSEKGSTRLIDYLNSQDEVISASFAEAEVFSAATRENVPLSSAKTLLDSISLIQPDRSLRMEYERIFSMGYIRGADAYHLACALYLDPQAKEIEFLTADREQEKIARSIGFRISFKR